MLVYHDVRRKLNSIYLMLIYITKKWKIQFRLCLKWGMVKNQKHLSCVFISNFILQRGWRPPGASRSGCLTPSLFFSDPWVDSSSTELALVLYELYGHQQACIFSSLKWGQSLCLLLRVVVKIGVINHGSLGFRYSESINKDSSGYADFRSLSSGLLYSQTSHSFSSCLLLPCSLPLFQKLREMSEA